jgi:hypothetical protein
MSVGGGSSRRRRQQLGPIGVGGNFNGEEQQKYEAIGSVI